jgi:hypothetical protein
MLNVRVVLFESVPASVMAFGVLKFTVTDCAVAVGAVYGLRVTVAGVLVRVDAASRTMDDVPLS